MSGTGGDAPTGEGEGVSASSPSARKWQLEAAPAFLRWRDENGSALAKMESLAEAVHRAAAVAVPWDSPPCDVAACLPGVLSSCDDLVFEHDAEVRAYAALHLVDRYGRVMQVLEYLLSIGCLPLRRRGIAALEVGAGPAPALYALRDFYDDLAQWPGRGDWSTGSLRVCDALDRAFGWDHYLHMLSEALIAVRHIGPGDGRLPFGRALGDFSGLDIRAIHHESIVLLASQIEADYDRADEWISRADAFRLAYESGTDRPSAYDLIFVPNFLTQAEAPEQFRVELRGLAKSLTPGGILVFMCGTGRQYVQIRSDLETLATRSGLTSVGPPEPLEANNDPARRAVVARQVRTTVAQILAACPTEQRALATQLPRDIRDESVDFTLPMFYALLFVNRNRPRK